MIPTAGPQELHALGLLEARFERDLRRAIPHSVFDRSLRRGRQLADAIFAWSRNDGGHEGYLRNLPPYAPPEGPGLWVPTPPSFLAALQPYWGGNRCFALANGAAFPPGDHPRYSEKRRSRFGREAREVYDTVNSVTSEQEAIARFWSDDPGATPTPADSVSIATQVLRQERSSLAEAADEAALSRLSGGIHYRATIENGLAQGRRIGRAVSRLPLRS